jgi:predicted NACHT family NTPase
VSRDYPATKIIVTSRVYGYQNYARSLTDHGFCPWLLEDLDDEQIQQFCDRWHYETFEDSEKADRDRCRKRLENAIAQRRTIRELAGNPLMLTMMCILNRKSQLPDERLEFYRQATDLLLRDWDVEHKNLPDRCQEMQLTLNQKHKIVRRVAFYLQNTEGGLAGNLIREADLQAIVADYLRTLSQPNPEGWAEALIDSLCVRNFMLCSAGTGYYAFVHRTFLEYFCATEIYERFNQRDSGSQNAISADNLIHDIFGQYWNDDAWREVLVLLASQLPIGFAKQAIRSLVQLDETTSEKANFANLFLAADCLAELPERPTITDLDHDLLQRLRSLTDQKLLKPNALQMPPQEDLSERPKIIEMDHDLLLQLQSITDQALLKPNPLQRIFQDPSFLSRLAQSLLDSLREAEQGRAVQGRAVNYVARYWKNHPETLSWLKKHVSSDTEDRQHVRQAAVQNLAQGWKDEPDILLLLEDLARSDRHENVQQLAVQELARGWKSHPGTLPLLKNLAQSDRDKAVQQVAMQELARGWKDHPDTLLLSAKWEKSCTARQTALQELVRSRKNDPNTILLLKECAASDENWDVRQTALQELARGWKDHPDILPWLKERARLDHGWTVRQAAVQELARGWKDHPDTLRWLREQARSDNDWAVQQAAIEELVRGWKGHPNMLCSVTTQDPF